MSVENNAIPTINEYFKPIIENSFLRNRGEDKSAMLGNKNLKPTKANGSIFDSAVTFFVKPIARTPKMAQKNANTTS